MMRESYGEHTQSRKKSFGNAQVGQKDERKKGTKIEKER